MNTKKLKKNLHKLKVKALSMMGLALDVASKNNRLAKILSNSAEHHFVFDGVQCGGIEGFLQAIKHRTEEHQIQICTYHGRSAKHRANRRWMDDQTLYWKGEHIDRHSERFQELVRSAYRALIEQCPKYREALAATGKKKIYDTKARSNPRHTILTEKEFTTILTELRSEL